MNAPASISDQLTASLELLAAIEAIEITEGHEWAGECDCHKKLSECTEVFDGCCSVECCALQLLWNCTEEQDQSPRAVQWCESMIRQSFARAARKGGA